MTPQPQPENPYRAPTTLADPSIPAIVSPEAIRRKHLSRETSVQALGGLSLMIALGLFFLGGRGIVEFFRSPPAANQAMPVSPIAIGILTLVLGTMFGVAGIGMRLLRPWGQITAACLGGLTILLSLAFGFHPGGIVMAIPGAFVLFLLCSPKGRRIFSAEYRNIIQATPHVRMETAFISWFILILFLSLFPVLFFLIA